MKTVPFYEITCSTNISQLLHFRLPIPPQHMSSRGNDTHGETRLDVVTDRDPAIQSYDI
jgi:hypothetical protein